MTQVTATFETGVDGANVATTDPGSLTAWDTIVKSGSSTIVYSTTHVYDALSAKLDAGVSGSAHWMEWTTGLGTVTNHYGRVYIWRDTLSSGANHFWLTVYGNGSADLCGRYFITTAGVIGLQQGSGAGAGTGSVTVATGQWVRLEYKMINSTTAGIMEVKLFNDPASATPSETITSASDLNTRVSTDTLRFGSEQGSDANYLYYMDNIVGGATSYPGPVGGVPAPQVLSMQTHVFGHGVW